MPIAPAQLSAPIAIMCEGKADEAFFRHLLTREGLTEIACVFPPSGTEAHGRGGFAAKLRRLANDARLDPAARDLLRGVVIAVDTAEDGAETFRHVRDQIAPPFLKPDRHDAFISPPASLPWPVAILPVPAYDRPGGLETLCLDYVAIRHPALVECVAAYFECVPDPPRPRTRERHDKARLACAFSACSIEDPTRSLAYAFNGDAPVIDVEHACFDSIATRLGALIGRVGAGG